MLPLAGVTAEQAWEAAREQETPFPAMRDLDVVLPVERFLEGGPLKEKMEKALGLSLSIADPYAARGLRFQAYIAPPTDRARFVLHATNYNVPLDVPADKRAVAPVRDVNVTLRLPFDWRAQSARILSAAAPEQALSITPGEEPEVVRFTMPAVEAYTLVLIDAVVRGAPAA
jgi:hypothetical protein